VIGSHDISTILPVGAEDLVVGAVRISGILLFLWLNSRVR
jgi:hypothetical protein